MGIWRGPLTQFNSISLGQLTKLWIIELSTHCPEPGQWANVPGHREPNIRKLWFLPVKISVVWRDRHIALDTEIKLSIRFRVIAEKGRFNSKWQKSSGAGPWHETRNLLGYPKGRGKHSWEWILKTRKCVNMMTPSSICWVLSC